MKISGRNCRKSLWTGGLLCCAASLLVGCLFAGEKPLNAGQSHHGWSDYGGGADSAQYSALTQINRSNVSQLKVAWTYPTGDVTANDYYQFRLGTSNLDLWDIPTNNSNSNGFLYSQVNDGAGNGKLTWNVDPTGGGSSVSVPNLTTGTVYTWSVTSTDANGNQGTKVVSYQP